MHVNAVPAALAVEAAAAQGKHVEMANKLFATQNDWKNIKERDKLRTLKNIFLVNKDHLAMQLGHTPTRAEVYAKFFERFGIKVKK